MKAPVSLDRAKTIIQGWYNEYCKDHGKSAGTLHIQEDEGARAYKVSNPESGGSTAVFWSTVSDYEQSGSVAVPAELKGSIWDSLQDLK